MYTLVMSNLHDPTGYFNAYRYFSHASVEKRTRSTSITTGLTEYSNVLVYENLGDFINLNTLVHNHLT